MSQHYTIQVQIKHVVKTPYDDEDEEPTPTYRTRTPSGTPKKTAAQILRERGVHDLVNITVRAESEKDAIIKAMRLLEIERDFAVSPADADFTT